MIPTSVHLAPRCGLGTKVPRPMANLGGQESLVVLLERKDGPEKLAGQSSGRYLRNPPMGGPFRVATYETQDHRSFGDDRPDAGLVQARNCAEPVHCANHGRLVLRPESLQSSRMSGSRIVGRPDWQDLFGDFHRESPRKYS